MGYITIDLGGTYSLDAFELFNTHNSYHFDRDIGVFEILASNDILADGENGYMLSGSITRLVSGTLAAGTDPIAGAAFASSSAEYSGIYSSG